ncbi:hypothetical protein DL766_003722 [Monosporascus sp. MC13-8B]|uniref:N-acetyltransferase domain-containing protein n=1 Tax=Monosporascus cannonballus TaxID=155416 RepID=A0ABY0H3C0_9PEZI|nr:hypothetical protein DL762_006104 [Monosporascus cannonballus]RYO88266.1 hypothetical protein DL763_006053 [Monosporascus cannonballus]RYP32998.1 hypothetical protein DL766_003722 [Monosporascus sp. MC13-8B]
MDDPSSPTIYRVSGAPPFPDPNKPELPPNVLPRKVTLRDRQTVATVVPFISRDQAPASLLAYLSDQFAKEIEGGDTYPMIKPMPLEKFGAYWFQNFAGIMLLGSIDGADQVAEGKDWSKECLGSFYIKPNYPGRSSHVCNAGFLVTEAARNRGVGRLMGEAYLDWAPKLGYTYSVFNLVYETNVASCRIWDALGFKRIGRVKGCGNLKSYPDRLVDAIIYGRDLGTGAEGDGQTSDPLLVSEERFDKIKYYLKYGRYPNGSDRAEKSRLRSAATHYKLLENDVLMLKGKEVISDPPRQMEISRTTHEAMGHAGINKTTAVIAEKYHWSRIKETVSEIIKICNHCKDLSKAPLQQQNPVLIRRGIVNGTAQDSVPQLPPPPPMAPQISGIGDHEPPSRILDLQPRQGIPPIVESSSAYANPNDISSLLNPPLQPEPASNMHPHEHMLHNTSHHRVQQDHETTTSLGSFPHPSNIFHPIDPQIITQPQPRAQADHDHDHHHHHHPFEPFHHGDTPVHPGPPSSHASLQAQDPYSPHSAHPPLPVHPPFHPHGQQHHHHEGSHPFHNLLHDDPQPMGPHEAPSHQPEPPDQDAVDRDIDMLIEHGDDSEMEVDVSQPLEDRMKRDGGPGNKT